MEVEASFGAEKAASSRRTPKSEGAAMLPPTEESEKAKRDFLPSFGWVGNDRDALKHAYTREKENATA